MTWSLPYARKRSAACASVYSGHAARHLRKQQACRAIESGKNYSGKWKKDFGRSDSLDPTAEMYNLNFLARKGARLASILIIDDSPERFSFCYRVSSMWWSRETEISGV